MVLYNCQKCNFMTSNKYNYDQHLKTKKHLRKMTSEDPQNEGNEEENEDLVPENEDKNAFFNTNKNLKEEHFVEKSPQYICQFCQKNFSRSDNLKRHISVCKLTQTSLGHQKAPKSTEILDSKSSLNCPYCQQTFSRQYTLNRHYGRCKILKLHKSKE